MATEIELLESANTSPPGIVINKEKLLAVNFNLI